jgi:predicted AAA+ superfamily ATPase
VLIEGPKACGKTETARRQAASEVLLDVDENARAAAAIDPGLVLDGPTPRLIDEWQQEPRIWNHLRRAVDDRQAPGQFILAGSATPTDDDTRHTGTGRIMRLRMRPMSLFEAEVSTGDISLADLLNGERASSRDAGLSVKDLADEIARGGWPGTRGLGLDDALQATRAYLDEVCRTDIHSVDGVRRDPNKVQRVLHSLARNVATSVTATTLGHDAGGSEGPIADETVATYLDALRRLFVLEDQPAWAPHLRSKYNLRRAARRHFVDPSLAVAALRTAPGPLLKDLNLLGLLFESMVIRDLRIYAQGLDGEILQYRDNSDLEVDAIISASDGRWAAFEIKLGSGLIDEGAASLQKFLQRVDTAKCGDPAAVGVIVGDGYGYVRDDGIQVVPIGALGP